MGYKASYYICAVAAVLFWGTSFIATKIAYQSFGPLMLCLIRFALSGALMAVIRLIRHDHQKIHKKDFPYMLAISLIGISIYYSCENIAVSMTSAATASLISGAYPAMTGLIGVLFYHLKMNGKQLTGVLMAIAGVVVLTDFSSGMRGNHELAGDLIMIFDGFLWAFYNFLIPQADHEYSTFTLTYYQTLIGTLFLIPGALMEHASIGNISPAVITAVLFLTLGCSVGAYLMYNFALKGIKPSSAAVIMNLMPVAGLIFSAVILQEPITLRHLIGAAVIIAGVILSTS